MKRLFINFKLAFASLTITTLMMTTLVSCQNKSEIKSKKINTHLKFQSENSQIINGELQENLKYPYNSIVGLYDEKENFTCTGVLISAHLVLTAAHCVVNDGKGLIVYFTTDLYTSIELGTKPEENSEVRSVVKAVAHNKYVDEINADKEGDWNDIAIIQFAGDFPASYSPINLDNIMPKEGTDVLVAGFGVYQVGRAPISKNESKEEIKNRVDNGEVICYGKKEFENCYEVTMKDDGLLRSTTVKVFDFYETEFITDEEKNGTCVGDSGGPVFRKNNDRYVLTGITSRGAMTCNVDGVYTSIAAQSQWISLQMEKLNQ